MFRFSRAYHRAKNGIYIPDDPDDLRDPSVVLQTNEYITLLKNMEADFKSGRVPDLLLDDRDIAEPENFFEFYVGKDGLNESGSPVWTPFGKQVQAATNVLQEHCTNKVGHLQCTDLAYVSEIPTDAKPDQMREKIAFLKHGVCPSCGKTRMDQWNEGNGRKDLLVMAIGQRAGKDQSIGLIGGYLHARYLTLRNLARAYKQAEGTTFYTTFTATTFGQARKATFGPFSKIIQEHPWFKRYHEMLDYSGQKAGAELYKIGLEAIVWPHHGLAVQVEAPHEGNLRGNAKIFGSITEYAYFYSKAKDAIKLNGPAIFDAMNNSFGTIKIGYRKCIEAGLYNMPPYLFPLASSPRTNKDGIMSLYRESKKTSTMYGMHYSTFDFNPDAREEDFITNRAASMDHYRTSILALPADAIKGFIKSRRLVSTMPDDDYLNAVFCKSVPIKAGAGMSMTTGAIRMRDDVSIDKTTPKVLGMDAGSIFNSFSCVIAHVEIDVDEKTKEETYYTAVDAVIEIIPIRGKRINYRSLYDQVLRPICEELNVQYLIADRWESTRFIDDLDQDLGVSGLQYKCTYTDFLFLRAGIDDHLVILPKNEIKDFADPLKNIDRIFNIAEVGYPHCFDKKPIAHLLYQILTVEDLAGKTVDKGENSTDDTFRALVLAHKFCHDPEIRENVLSSGHVAAPEDSFSMLSMGLDGRVMDQKNYANATVDIAPTPNGQSQPFGIVVAYR